MQSIKLEMTESGILSLIFDRLDRGANTIDDLFTNEFVETVETITQNPPKGILMRSAKSSFFAGGDLDHIYQSTQADAAILFDMVERLKLSMRTLETLGIPIVACLEGTALGGGWELALSCHHRIMLNHPKVKVGLPEVTLGLLPGGGGITRSVRLFGLQATLPLLTEGKKYDAKSALELGLVHDVASSKSELIERAQAWIESHPQVQQPWDVKGYRIPGGSPTSPKLAPILAIAPALIRKKTKGVFPAPELILATMVEGALVDFDTASRIESRHFVELVCSPVTKNMINAFWYQLNEIKSGLGRPQNIAPKKFKKVAVLGAGMMGAGVAYVSAKAGIEVILKDVSIERAEQGKDYSRNLVAKGVKRQRISQELGDQLLTLIKPCAYPSELSGAELVIEAVFENRGLKAQVTREAEAELDDQAIFASNTSTLPITGLAKASHRPEQFIGLHFFSPVDKMQLVEIICGESTNKQTLAHAYDFVQQLGKIPIVVNDRRGFFTSRVFGTYTQEGIAMLGEGIPAAMIESAAALAGFPIGPLAVSDEVSLTLMSKIRQQADLDYAAEGKVAPLHPAHSVIDTMLELNRAGKLAGQGFYDYPQNSKKHLWSGLSDTFSAIDNVPSLQELKDRLLYIMALETARCLEEA
ncbi:MAG: 3-hydroxyacyl-CoA dehydrogenase, partial [Myxococcales bacterium]|nr:3-hydroxyacyl-CoA dehydrogenase [Myxococcales bacterium]